MLYQGLNTKSDKNQTPSMELRLFVKSRWFYKFEIRIIDFDELVGI